MRAVAIDRVSTSRRRIVVGGAILAAGIGSMVQQVSAAGRSSLVGLGAAVIFIAVAVLRAGAGSVRPLA